MQQHADLLSLTAQIVASHCQRNPVQSDRLTTLIRDVYMTFSGLQAGETFPLPAMVHPDIDRDIDSQETLMRRAHKAQQQQPAPQPPEEEPPRRNPAVEPKESVFPSHIICLEDGKKLKMLKRHLATHYNLTPEQYRERWGLPGNYPMVAPNYAQMRSNMAKANGLGRGGRFPVQESADIEPHELPRQPLTVTRVPEGISGYKTTRRKQQRAA